MHDHVYGLSHITIPVATLKRSIPFYERALGFSPKATGEGWVDLDACPIAIRLIETEDFERRAALRVQVATVDSVFTELVKAGGQELYRPTKIPNVEEMATVRDFDGNTITVWRPLSEDEFDHVPELPIATEWSPEAQDLLKSLLLAVPSLFRGLARRKIVRIAEEMFANKCIGREEVVRAYILSSAKITRYRLREPLIKHGFDLNKYAEEFNAD